MNMSLTTLQIMSERTSTRVAGFSQRTPEQKRRAANYARQWRHANPEKAKAAWHRWYQKHKVKRLKYCKNYLSKHANHYGDLRRKYHEKNRARRNEYSRRWAAENRDRRRKYMLAYCKRNKAHRRAVYQRWVANNPRKVQARNQKWRDQNPHKIAATNAARKSYRRGGNCGDKAVADLIASWKSQSSFVCYWCGRRFARNRLHIDHIIPVKKGGQHRCDNVCRSCSTCNVRKKHRLVTDPEFIGQRQLPL